MSPLRRVAMVSFSSLGGSGRMAVELARQLARRGIETHFISAGRPRGLSGPGDDARPEGIELVDLEVPEHPVWDGAPYTMTVASALMDLCARMPVDVIHGHYAVPHAASMALTRAALGASAPPAVLTLHGTDVTRLGNQSSLRTATAHALRAADRLTAPSQFLKEEALRTFGALPDLEVVHNFVDTTLYRPAERPDRRAFQRFFPTRGVGQLVVMHVSNLRPIKRVQDALLALAHLNRRLDARLVVVGEGPTRDALERQAEEMRLTPLVAFPGARSDVHELLPHADAFIFPSESESFGLAALEALACGTPVVATRVGGLPEVVADAGELVPLEDPMALALGLQRVVAQPGLRSLARQRAEQHFSPTPLVEQTLEIYRAVRTPLAERDAL